MKYSLMNAMEYIVGFLILMVQNIFLAGSITIPISVVYWLVCVVFSLTFEWLVVLTIFSIVFVISVVYWILDNMDD